MKAIIGVVLFFFQARQRSKLWNIFSQEINLHELVPLDYGIRTLSVSYHNNQQMEGGYALKNNFVMKVLVLKQISQC